jgi:8-hydroxy-5-deazaflavin:NADPH oxidoreductase
MKIGVLGTGMVGDAIATKLTQLGHQVKMGSRSAVNEKAAVWVKKVGANGSQGTYAEAAQFGELLFNCVNGVGTMDALKSTGEENLNGKILVDVSNPLVFATGMPPSLWVGNTDSLGEQIQRAYPKVKVVKSLNTMNASVMVNPGMFSTETAVFVCGNDADAKKKVVEILRDGFGWKQILDLGDIKAARGTEAYVPFWVMMMTAQGTPTFNIKIVK